jgi:hypothetical protein
VVAVVAQIQPEPIFVFVSLALMRLIYEISFKLSSTLHAFLQQIPQTVFPSPFEFLSYSREVWSRGPIFHHGTILQKSELSWRSVAVFDRAPPI